MRVRPVTRAELPGLLALIADYQRYYGNAAPRRQHNAACFGEFVAPSERGMLVAAHDEDGAPAGYTCLYWTYSSVSASEVVLLNDLFVLPSRRGAGVGEALIAAARDIRA